MISEEGFCFLDSNLYFVDTVKYPFNKLVSCYPPFLSLISRTIFQTNIEFSIEANTSNVEIILRI